MQKGKRIAQSIFIIIILSFGSKILGFAREVLIAAKFGSGTETDTFFVALAGVSLFKAMVVQSINTTMIPVLSDVENVSGKKGKQSYTNNLLNLLILISIVIVVLGWIMTPYILRILAYGFEGSQFELAVYMMRIGLIIILFSAIVGVFRGYLQSENMFIESAAADFPFNFVYIVFLIFLSSLYGIEGLIVTSVLAVASQILVQIPGLRKAGFRYKPIINIKDENLKKIVYLIPPVLLNVVIIDINKIVDKSMASTLIDGSVSALNYADRLTILILGVFITAITTVIFPILSREANKDSYDELKKVINNGINSIIIITLPATVGLIVLAKPIVKLAFERGAFDSEATAMTAGALVFYSLGLVGIALRLLMDKVYYSLKDTKTPMLNGALCLGINIALNFALINIMGHKGLAFATSISATITSLFLMYGLKGKIGSLGLINSVKCGIKSLIASLIMGLLVYVLYNYITLVVYDGIVVQIIVLLFTIGFGAIVYLAIIYLLKVKEINWLMSIAKNRLKKIRGRNH